MYVIHIWIRQGGNMARNVYLDRFKNDIKSFNKLFKEIHEEVQNITDDDGFNKENNLKIRKSLKVLSRDIKRIRDNAGGLDEYIMEGALFAKIRLRLYEIYSGLKVLELACKTDEELVYREYLDDILSTLARISENILSLTIVIKSQDMHYEEIKHLKPSQNRLTLLKI